MKNTVHVHGLKGEDCYTLGSTKLICLMNQLINKAGDSQVVITVSSHPEINESLRHILDLKNHLAKQDEINKSLIKIKELNQLMIKQMIPGFTELSDSGDSLAELHGRLSVIVRNSEWLEVTKQKVTKEVMSFGSRFACLIFGEFLKNVLKKNFRRLKEDEHIPANHNLMITAGGDMAASSMAFIFLEHTRKVNLFFWDEKTILNDLLSARKGINPRMTIHDYKNFAYYNMHPVDVNAITLLSGFEPEILEIRICSPLDMNDPGTLIVP